MNDFQQQLTQSSPESRQEWTGKFTSRLAIVLIGGLVGTILIFLTVKGVALFTDNGVSVWRFFSQTDWQPGHHHFGAFPMLVTSFGVTLLAGAVSLPLALVVAVAITEILPGKVKLVFQPLIELLADHFSGGHSECQEWDPDGGGLRHGPGIRGGAGRSDGDR